MARSATLAGAALATRGRDEDFFLPGAMREPTDPSKVTDGWEAASHMIRTDVAGNTSKRL